MKRRIILLAAFAVLGALAAIVARGSCQQPSEPPPKMTGPSTSVASRSEPAATTRAAARLSTGASSDAGKLLDVIGSLDPRSNNYDPIVIQRVMNTSPLELMNKEPRDPAFAAPRELALKKRITERLRKRVPFELKVEANCHTSSCEVTLAGDRSAEEMDTALQAIDLSDLAETGMVGALESPANSPQSGIRLIVLFPASLRDHAAYEKLLRQHKEHDEP